MRRTLVVGCGNPLRQDDGLGWTAAAQLSDENTNPLVKIITCEQLNPELATEMSEADRVIIVDASTIGHAGQVKVEKVMPNNSPTRTMSHELQLATLLTYAGELYHSSPETFIITVSGESFGYGDQLTPAVSGALKKTLQTIQTLVNE